MVSLRLKVLAASVLVLAVPLAVALALTDVPFTDELIVFGLAVLLGTGLALAVSHALTRPVRELSDAAARIARGEIGWQVPVRTADEVGAIARSLNELSETLRRHITDADASRDEVRHSVRRLGEALRSTGPQDLTKLLSVVLETALVAAGGRAGAIWLLSANRGELYLKVGRRLEPSVAQQRIPLGRGLAGWVAEHRREALVPSDEGPTAGDPEPVEHTALAVPLETNTQLLGVLALYGRDSVEPFRREDLDVIHSLARQAGIGVDNVLLHQEAERLSITDGLTGIWNRRYFQMQYAAEFERVIRFGRRLALLMIDIDHFKVVNDRWGHQRGDGTLVELARRVVSHVRMNIDLFARYGGEEFVLMLPETDLDGARIAAEKIRSEIAGASFGGEDEAPVEVTVSIGFAVYPQHGRTPQLLLHAADQALYAAKTGGRNRVIDADEIGIRDVGMGEPVAPDPAHQ